MKLEIKRMLRSGFLILFLFINILAIILGYILLITIDHVKKISFEELFESVYTVYTQFGILMFSALIIMQFYNDYKDKNIIFYKTLGYTSIKYFFVKIFSIFIATLLGTVISSLIISIPYLQFKMFPIVFFKLESVMIYYVIVISTLSFIFNNFLLTFFINLLLWIIGIVISSMSKYMKYFAYFDASNYDYKYLMAYLDGKENLNDLMVQIIQSYIFNIILILICITLVLLFSKRWIKNGI